MNQGEVWLIDLDPTIGAEIEKTRPAVIVNDDLLGKLPLKVVVPITDWKNRFGLAPWMVKIQATKENGLVKDSAADCFQIRSISEKRFVSQIGHLSEPLMDEIKAALSKVFAMTD